MLELSDLTPSSPPNKSQKFQGKKRKTTIAFHRVGRKVVLDPASGGKRISKFHKASWANRWEPGEYVVLILSSQQMKHLD